MCEPLTSVQNPGQCHCPGIAQPQHQQSLSERLSAHCAVNSCTTSYSLGTVKLFETARYATLWLNLGQSGLLPGSLPAACLGEHVSEWQPYYGFTDDQYLQDQGKCLNCGQAASQPLGK